MIPNYLQDVVAARDKYPVEWAAAHVDGHPLKRAFIIKLATDLNAKDPNVGCNGKRGNPNDLSMDALNIFDDEDGPGRTPAGKRCWVVDVIGGAGGPNPTPTWQAFTDPVASSGAWVHPKVAALPLAPPAPPSRILPKGEAFAKLQALNAFYAAPEGLQRPGGMVLYDEHGRAYCDTEAVSQWFHQIVVDGVSLEDVFMQIRSIPNGEWQQKHPGQHP